MPMLFREWAPASLSWSLPGGSGLPLPCLGPTRLLAGKCRLQGLGVLPKIPFLGPSQGIQTSLRLGYRCPWLGGTVCQWGSWSEEDGVILEPTGRQGGAWLAWKEIATRVVMTEVEVALRQAVHT